MYKMLIVDDEKWIRQGIAGTFNWKELGIDVCMEAADGAQAIELCCSMPPEIIITDIRMNGMSGLDFLNTIKNMGIESKIIIISGFGDFSYAQKAISLGVYKYLLKPIDEAELVQTVKSIVRELNNDGAETCFVGSSLINEALQFLEDHYSEHITMSSVANYLHVSNSYFSKLFKEKAGKTFSQYLQELRLKKSLPMVKSSRYKIYEIAERVGYSSYRQFSKAFCDQYGMTPTEYRNAHG